MLYLIIVKPKPFIMKIILTILLTAIVATTIIHISEQYFGSANVFIAATSIVFIFGGIVIPIAQIKNKP